MRGFPGLQAMDAVDAMGRDGANPERIASGVGFILQYSVGR
ncbi:hypothetical protein [Microbulbifer yueqingensis]|nr:hypothetical protein [Microbulbifer yueqingensis]